MANTNYTKAPVRPKLTLFQRGMDTAFETNPIYTGTALVGFMCFIVIAGTELGKAKYSKKPNST